MIITNDKGVPLPRDEQYDFMTEDLDMPAEDVSLMLAIQFGDVESDIEIVDNEEEN